MNLPRKGCISWESELVHPLGNGYIIGLGRRWCPTRCIVADGVVLNLGALLVQHDDEDDDGPAPVRLAPLNPQRSALDLLGDLLTGIRGCRLLHEDYVDADDQETSIDSRLCGAVCEEAVKNSARLV